MSNLTYSPAKLKKFKAIITQKFAETTAELEQSQQDQKQQKEHISNTNVDFNQSSKHFQQQAKNKQLVRRLQRKANDLRNALKRIENGSYGVCTRTGQLIREARLEAMPTATFDIAPVK